MADAVVELAYTEARAALREQESALSNVRNRATGLLAAATVGTSLSATAGLLNTDPDRGRVFPGWAGWILLLAVALIATGALAVLWPAKAWSFGPSPSRLLSLAGTDVDAVRSAATTAMVASIATNDRVLKRRLDAYRVTAVVLMLEIGVLVTTLIFVRGET